MSIPKKLRIRCIHPLLYYPDARAKLNSFFKAPFHKISFGKTVKKKVIYTSVNCTFSEFQGTVHPQQLCQFVGIFYVKSCSNYQQQQCAYNTFFKSIRGVFSLLKCYFENGNARSLTGCKFQSSHNFFCCGFSLHNQKAFICKNGICIFLRKSLHQKLKYWSGEEQRWMKFITQLLSNR